MLLHINIQRVSQRSLKYQFINNLGADVKAKLEIKESPEKGVFIKDLSINAAKTHGQLMEYMNIGNMNRSVGETAMNKDSSRSHLLFMLYL